MLREQSAALHNISALVFVNFFTAGLGFVTMVKIANVMGRATFGNLVYAMAIGVYGAAIVRYGMGRTLVRDLVHFPERAGELVVASVVLRAVLLGLIVVALLIWMALAGPAGSLSWGAVAVVVATSAVSLDLQAVYDASGKTRRHSVYYLIQRCSYFTVAWFLILFFPGRLTIWWIGLGMMVSVALGLGTQYRWAMGRIVPARGAPIWKTVVSMCRGNFWIWLSAVGGLSFGYVNQVILKGISGSTKLGGYAAAWQVAAVAILFTYQVVRVGRPAMGRMTRPTVPAGDRRRFLVRYTAVIVALIAPIGLSAILFPHAIICMLFSPEYASAANILRLMGVYVIVLAAGMGASQYVIFVRKEKTYLVTILFGGALSILLCWFLIPMWSGFGAAVALLAAHSVTISLYIITVVRHLRRNGP